MRRRLLYIYLLLIAGIIACETVIVEAAPNFYFKQLSQQDGLSQNFVRSIMLDHDGFLWVGTKSGISRFDYHEFKNYSSVPDSAASLPGNLVHFIVEDARHNIWISTDKGVCVYQRESDDFKTVLWRQKALQAHSYLLTDDALFWGGRGVIYRWDYHRAVMDTVPVRWKDKSYAFFNHMIPWSEHYWVLSSRWNGLWLLDCRTGEIERPTFCKEKEIMSVKVDTQGDLWISPYGKGLDRYIDGGRKQKHYDVSNSDLTNNVILDIEERDGSLWLATDGGGISILNLKDETFSNIRYTPGNIYSFPYSSVFCLYKDRDDNMWAGTIRGGLFGIKEVHMRTYRDVSPGNHYGMSDKTALCLYEDEDGIIWVGTDGGGLNRLEPKSNRFTHYPNTYGYKVASITRYNERELLMYFFSKGLYLFDKRTGNLRPFTLLNDRRNEEIIHSGISVNVDYFDTDKIHLFADKIYTYDKSTGSFTIAHVADSSRYYGTVQRFYSDKDITYLFGRNYILRLDHAKNAAVCLLAFGSKAVINAACRDDEGNFWIGTDKGLFHYDVNTQALNEIKTNMFREVTSVAYANQYLWLGADGLLFRYSIGEDKFFIYGESDGAIPNEYLHKSTLVTRDGAHIYMGGVTGLLHIDREIYKEYNSLSPSSVELSDVVLDGKSVMNKMGDTDRSLRVAWNYTSLTLKTMVREKDIFRKKMFRFNIEGLGRSEIETYDHTLTLYTLPAGTYRVMASCSTEDGGWSQSRCILQIEVVPPWWKSFWFIALVVIVAAGLCYLMISYTVKRKNSRLQLEMKERERKVYEDKVRFLINVSHELRTPLTLIYAPLKRLLKSGTVDDTLKTQLMQIFKQARRMRNIINMVLDMRRMEVGYEALHLAPYSLNEWVRAVIGDFSEEFESKKIMLLFNPDETIDKISFDREKCEIVLSNLLMNAFKFSEEGTVVTVITERRESCVRISVKDYGIGLNESDLSHLFTRFYQGDHRLSGSGIGLSYSKTLLVLHGGEIGAYNNEDKGATFWFELPLAYNDEDVACAPGMYLNDIGYATDMPETTVPEKDFPLQDYSILIIDDEMDIRSFIKTSFSGVFKQIYSADDGVNGLHVVHQCQPDLVICDIMMPHMDGFEFCRLLKSDIQISHIPVILLTARDNPDSLAAGYKLGADFYLAKPFDDDVLLTVIRNLLWNREQIKNYYRDAVQVSIMPKNQTFSNADEQFLLKLNKLVLDNIDNSDLDVKYLTVEMGMSRASLYNKVKALTGLGVNDLINRIRIEQAMRLLTDTDIPIAEVSERIGFSNARYFSTCFKQFTSMTPREYREQKRNEPSA